MKNFLQYELWKNCNNRCKFCYNLGQKNYSDIKNRLRTIIEDIKNIDYKKFSDFGITGGEFFDGQLDELDLKNDFYILINEICKKIKEKKIIRFLVNTSFIYKSRDDIIFFIETLKHNKCLTETLFCTSFDTIHRFNESSLKTWKDNMKFLYKKYKIRIHTEIIITNDFCKKILNDEFNIIDFQNKYHTFVDFIQPAVPYGLNKTKKEFEKTVKNFFPERKIFLSTIKKLQNMGYDLTRFLSIDDHADETHCVLNGKIKNVKNRTILEKYISPYRKPNQVGYIDSDKFMREDVELFLLDI